MAYVVGSILGTVCGLVIGGVLGLLIIHYVLAPLLGKEDTFGPY